MNRRDFLTTTALASGGFFTGFETLPNLTFTVPDQFSITILATNWGFSGSFDQFCAQAKQDNYDGIEVWVPRNEAGQKDLQELTTKYGLRYGLLAGAGGSDFNQHFDAFKQSVDAAIALNPLFINCHSGRDYFTFEQNQAFFDYTIQMSQASGIPIYHETHRARILFAAHVARSFFEAIPDLQVTLDISHWCAVAGSLLEDQGQAVDIALQRTKHIHSRIGHANGPQVGDPRAPEWQQALEAHFSWWDTIVEQHVAAKQPLTMTTEFGPPSYMPTLPFTNQPITDLWAINTHMKDLWRERY
ncbi:MAG: sugar phosphate isomerase/epimerase [Saprospiraceae bacterium]|nr:sugar phosphate isomerase/epimerase [Saprospiraceae bacterium]